MIEAEEMNLQNNQKVSGIKKQTFQLTVDYKLYNSYKRASHTLDLELFKKYSSQKTFNRISG